MQTLEIAREAVVLDQIDIELAHLSGGSDELPPFWD